MSRHLATVREMITAAAGLPIRPGIIVVPQTRFVVPQVREWKNVTVIQSIRMYVQPI